MMIKNQFQVAETIDDPIMFSDDTIQKYRQGANPMVDSRTAEAEQNRRSLIRNLVQGMMARNNVAAQQQQGGGQMPTIVEVEKQKMAQQQAMQQQLIAALTSSGVGSLPTKPDMFSRGGGVVAFSGKGETQFVTGDEDDTTPSKQSPYSEQILNALKFIPEIGFQGLRRLLQDPSVERENEERKKKERIKNTPIPKEGDAESPSAQVLPSDIQEEINTNKKSSKPSTQSSGSGGGERHSGQGLGSLDNKLKSITDRSRKISEELAKETEGETMLKERLKKELERTDAYRDLSEEQLDAIAKKRLEEMKAESSPLFEKMKANITERKGEKVGMSDEERRQAFIGRLGKRGPGWRNVFGESLEQEALQKAKDRDLNRARQDALAKEEMELARAEMLEARGQRKEADEAKKLALQARREAENARRQQAQAMISGTKALAEGERKTKELSYKPEQDALRAESDDLKELRRTQRQEAAAAANAQRMATPDMEKNYNFLVRAYIEGGMPPEKARETALKEVRTKYQGQGSEENMALKRQQLAAKDPVYKQLGDSMKIYSLAPQKFAAQIKDAEEKMRAIEAKYGISGGGIPAGANVMRFDAQGNPI